MADGGFAPGNRTTRSNAWKPPPSDGTTSPQRALRWQSAGQDGDEDGGVKRQVQYSAETDDARSAKSGSTAKDSSKKNSRRSSGKEALMQRSRSSEAGMMQDQQGNSAPSHLDWYGPPSFGEDASLGPGGSLYSFTKSGKPRPGMCNPPSNQKVAAALVADLNRWKVQPIVVTKKDAEREAKRKKKDAEREEKEKESRKMRLPSFSERQVSKASVQSGMSEDSGTSAHQTSRDSAHHMSRGGSDFASTAPSGGFYGGSTSSYKPPGMTGDGFRVQDRHPTWHRFAATRLVSEADERAAASEEASGASMRRTASLPSNSRSSTMRGGSPSVKVRKKKGESTWHLEEGKSKKPPLESAPEGEVKWRSRMVKLQARELGFELDQADVKELGHLSMYHNAMSRNMHTQHHSPLSPHQVVPSRQLRALHCDLENTSQSLSSIGSQAVMTEMGLSTRSLPGSACLVGPSHEENPSAERLQELAVTVMHAGPHQLQHLCQTAGISVHTGGKLPKALQSSSPQHTVEADVAIGRPLASPRTSTGKPLPVPYWGRNGNAPVLREHPELQAARDL